MKHAKWVAMYVFVRSRRGSRQQCLCVCVCVCACVDMLVVCVRVAVGTQRFVTLRVLTRQTVTVAWCLRSTP